MSKRQWLRLVGAVAATRQALAVGWMGAVGAGEKGAGKVRVVFTGMNAPVADADGRSPAVKSEGASVRVAIKRFCVRAGHEMTMFSSARPKMFKFSVSGPKFG